MTESAFRTTCLRGFLPGAAALLALVCFGSFARADDAPGAEGIDTPEAFPRFVVPDHNRDMAVLRDLYFLHYPGSTPKATLWDSWLPIAALWPAYEHGGTSMADQWRQALLGRYVDREGYLYTDQHLGTAHHGGWPFPGPGWPSWEPDGRDGEVYVFAEDNLPFMPDSAWRESLDPDEGWQTRHIQHVDTDPEQGLVLELTDADATITTPDLSVDTFLSPYLRITWADAELPENARPYVEWTTSENPDFSPTRRMYFQFEAPDDGVHFNMVPVYRHDGWEGTVRHVRIGFGNPEPARLTFREFIATYDSRHNINSAIHIKGCHDYVRWTGDAEFLEQHIGQLRKTLRYSIDEFEIADRHYVYTPWVGHSGRSGIDRSEDDKQVIFGQGVGNNYWDLMPFGGHDTLATMYHLDALRRMADLEQIVAERDDIQPDTHHPPMDPAELRQLADDVHDTASELFWNEQTGRFFAAIDRDGVGHDYGYTFVNFEAIYYGLATDEQARSILEWVDGERIIESDTATGEDIYRWRFAPRSTTKRNVDWYGFYWPNPEDLAFGDQVQDGGAVLGFSYHDLMSRLQVHGPDDAWQRLQAIIDWFEEVQAEGGYRAYYDHPDHPERGTLQGGGTPGGLGMDNEFFESAMVPQIMLYGFMGFEPTFDGFAIDPQLPSDWPSLTVTAIGLHGQLTFDIEATGDTIAIDIAGDDATDKAVTLPEGTWQVEGEGIDQTFEADGQSPLTLTFVPNTTLRFERTGG